VEQGEGLLLDDVAELAQTLDVRAGDDRHDPAAPQLTAHGLRVVRLVAQQGVGRLPRAAGAPGPTGSMPSTRVRVWVTSLTLTAAVVTWSGVPLPSPIRWCLLPESTGDGQVAASFARMWSHPRTRVTVRIRRPRAARRAGCGATARKTTACCQRSRRRPQVCPEPNPSSRGRSCQAMFWCRTYKTPCRHSRSGTGFGPGDRLGRGGSSGSISTHKSSSTIHDRVVMHHEQSNYHIGHAQPGRLSKILLRALHSDAVRDSLRHELYTHAGVVMGIRILLTIVPTAVFVPVHAPSSHDRTGPEQSA
jgi:hypothetical protein